MGRWMSPDPYAGSMDLGNPQSFNRYSYVLNNPMNYVDPTGLYYQDCTWTGDCWSGGHGGAGGGGGCTVDGLQTGCGNTKGLGSGTMAPCPNNDCAPGQRLQDNGSGSGMGFYNVKVVGYIFAQCDEAGASWKCYPTNTLVQWIADVDPNDLFARMWAQMQANQAARIAAAKPRVQPDTLSPFAIGVLGQVYDESKFLNNPAFYGCWYAASAAAGTLGSTAVGDAFDEAFAIEEDAGQGTRMFTGAAKHLVEHGVKYVSGICGYEGLH